MFRSFIPVAVSAMTLLLTGPSFAQAPEPAPAEEAEDPYLWLEEIAGERAGEWVRAHNQVSLATLQGDPRYQVFFDAALEIAESPARIPTPGFNRDGSIGNFHQDADHVRGIVRRTTLESYRSDSPQWETDLDVDALAAAEGANWVYQGRTCLQPEERYCLISLSDGGQDASLMREYDMIERRWIDGGFELPASRGGVSWIDRDTLILARDFGDGLTTSGFATSVRILKRGQTVGQAQEVLRVGPEDLAASSVVLRDADGLIQAILLYRQINFYESEVWRLNADGSKARVVTPTRFSLGGLVGDRLVMTIEQDWTSPAGQAFRIGDVIAYDLETWLTDPVARAEILIRPGERESIQGVRTTRNALVVALYENVRGAVYAYRPRAGGGWDRTRLNLPDSVSVSLGSASNRDDSVFINIQGYLTPSSLWLADAATGGTEQIKSLPAMFDATGLVVEQFEARSADGTLIPYSVIRRQDAPLDGSTPTLLYGYGGFRQSQLPFYWASMGKLWLERGGALVVSNLRGGAEFGPRWHQAALGANRHKTHEDFQAVALDLIARGITSPRRLGIMGGSQGGLLMGTMLTQRPDLIHAAVISAPLFDMLRYHRLSIGAAWIPEYGNPDIPEQRAWIEQYSPYQLLRAGQPYPEVFIRTSAKDDRVHPGHARKAAARMEELGYSVLFYETTDGGHSTALNLRERALGEALQFTYLSRRLMD